MIITKRSVAFILLAYVLTFVFGIVFSVAFGFDPASNPEQMSTPPIEMCIATIVTSAVVSALVSYLYFTFKKPKIKPTLAHGFKFGITMVVIGFILDLILFLPMVLSTGSMALLMSYYGKWYFWVSLATIVAGSAAVGHWLETKRKK